MTAFEGTYTYTVHLEPAEEGGFVVTVPALPGCMTQGETYDEALEMARDAIQGWIETLDQLGLPVPLEPQPAGPFGAPIQVQLKATA